MVVPGEGLEPPKALVPTLRKLGASSFPPPRPFQRTAPVGKRETLAAAALARSRRVRASSSARVTPSRRQAEWAGRETQIGAA